MATTRWLSTSSLAMTCAALAVGAALAVAMPGQAIADEPSIEGTTVYGAGYSTYDCGFEVVYTTDLRDTKWSWYDETGNVIRSIERVQNISQSWTNPVTGATLEGFGGGYTMTWEAPNSYGTFTGHLVTVTVPGVGNIMVDAGRVQISGEAPPYEFPFVAGPHDFWFRHDALCAYLQ